VHVPLAKSAPSEREACLLAHRAALFLAANVGGRRRLRRQAALAAAGGARLAILTVGTSVMAASYRQ